MTSKNNFGMEVEDILEDLTNEGVTIVIFNPKFSYNTNWAIELKKKDDGVSLEVRHESSTILHTVRDAYDKWHAMMDGKLRQHLGLPAIEHYESDGIYKPNETDEIEAAADNVVFIDGVPRPKEENGLKAPHEEAGVPKKNLDDDIPY